MVFSTKLLKAGLFIYFVLVSVSLLFAVLLLDFHEFKEGVIGLASVIGLSVAAAYRQARHLANQNKFLGPL